MIKDYYSLTKSGLVFGNLIPFIAGFALGSISPLGWQGGFDFPRFIIVAIGLALVMASGCVFNNYLDSDIDGAMARTRGRALVRAQRGGGSASHGRIASRAALAFGTALGALGFLALVLFTNALAVGTALVGFFFYVFMYSAWSKRRSAWGTAVGAVAGATPPVVGYAAASGRIDAAAVILFTIMVAWQMPHFYAIAIRRRDDYAAANIPVLPVASGVRAAKIHMLAYITAFTLIAPLLAVFGPLGSPRGDPAGSPAGRAYAVVALILGIAWLALCVKGLRARAERTRGDERWARTMFFASLAVMVTLFATLTLAAILKG